MSAPHPAPVLMRLVKTSKRINAMVAERFAPLGLHPGQDRLLGELWESDGLSQSELIARLGVEPPTVTGTVQRLERDGFVRREPDADNRRISRVYLTHAGRELERPVNDALREVERELLAPLAERDRKRVSQLLDSMLDVPARD